MKPMTELAYLKTTCGYPRMVSEIFKIGEMNMEYRIEHDSMGEVKVPADKYWAAQTERSHENFLIGVGIETMPREITHALSQ